MSAPVPTQRRKITRRGIVIVLAIASGLAGEVLAAVSMTRIAGPAAEIGGKLGFPAGGADVTGDIGGLDLRWTLFAVVSVAGWAGAVLWTSARAGERRMGAPINVIAAALAGTAVGLDHAVHAADSLPGEPSWKLIAFCIGLAIPLFSSWMVHVIAHMASDEPTSDEPTTAGSSTGVRERLRARLAGWVARRRSVAPTTAILTVADKVAEEMPAAIEPAVTEPAVTEPAATEPAAVEPTERRAPAPAPMQRRPSPRPQVPAASNGRWPTVAAAARAWLRRNWRPDMEPAALTEGLADPAWLGERITKQQASTYVKWAADTLPAERNAAPAREPEGASA